ncbi:uncharacterized protein Bfra_010634 [Botrytis fragariae]|uniref:Uncharacterized protein n=1 Tax=Botrytis fragariae TaxID=1964551 RepID=A0A8H6ECS5_9HELO|nr:uncharacterized protein Bfra_010634 [Botrytis fragariae]KAF5867659.1 hypothetical protein Bfra_010634 [Botrytis fragariae]
MHLLDRIQHSFKDRVKQRRQSLNESKIFGDGAPSTGGVQERTPSFFGTVRLFEAHASENLRPYPYETLDDVNDDVDDDGDSVESGFTNFLSENSEVRFVSDSISPGFSTALSPRLRSLSHRIQQETTFGDQCVSDSQRNDDHIRLDSDSRTSAEDLEIFGSPLERIKAGSSYPSSGWGIQDQIDLQMREDVEQSTPSSRPRNLHSKDKFVAVNSTRTDNLHLLFKLQEVQMPHRHRKSKRMMIPKSWCLPSENPHRQVGFYNGIFFNHASKNLHFKDNVRDSAIKGI